MTEIRAPKSTSRPYRCPASCAAPAFALFSATTRDMPHHLTVGDRCCSFIPPTQKETYVLYIKQTHETDYDTWLSLAKCWKIWDLEPRGYHKK